MSYVNGRRVGFSNVESAREKRTSSLIFFHMILVISSPSSSTTGCETTIFFAFSRWMSVNPSHTGHAADRHSSGK